MKQNISLVLSTIALILVVILFTIKDNNNNALPQKEAPTPIEKNVTANEEATTPNIAYIDAQRITDEYGYYKEIAKELEQKQKRAEAEFAKKAESFQNELAEYQKKAQMGAFLSAESQQRQEMSLREKQESLAVLEQDLSMKLQSDLQKLDAQAHDTIMKYLKGFNASMKYELILNKATILESGSTVDVTDTILSILNTQYEQQKSSKK